MPLSEQHRRRYQELCKAVHAFMTAQLEKGGDAQYGLLVAAMMTATAYVHVRAAKNSRDAEGKIPNDADCIKAFMEGSLRNYQNELLNYGHQAAAQAPQGPPKNAGRLRLVPKGKQKKKKAKRPRG